MRLFLTVLTVLCVSVGIALLVSDIPLDDEVELFAATLIVGVFLAYGISSVAIAPLRRLTASAVRAARGDHSLVIESRSDDEFGQLARALNELADALQHQMREAGASRDEVRNSVRRLGEALRSTHDLRKMLSVVLETALVAVRGKAGAVYLLTARRSELYVKAARKLDPAVTGARIPLGSGVAGWVAQHHRSVLLPAGQADAPVPVDPEPIESTALAVPLESQSQLIGVLVLYGRETGEPFRENDLEIIDSLARQAGVGIENVLLHQEAQRLSITDGLTGVWNHRYFQMSLSREFERAIRFQRPLSLIMVDIDHFKETNDRWGHQRGDAILIELSRRIVTHIRASIDVCARYGGEEFVLVLPETGVEGARSVAEKIRSEIAALPFGSAGEQPINVTISAGYATYPDHGLTPQVLLHAADQAMYEGKARGRNTVVGAEELLAAEGLAPGRASP
ncbi:MAG TPA: diguanylate cyclase [Actinomycetota bacterium]|nr:diguanylate cyclase [Actinomycetota bacterium]